MSVERMRTLIGLFAVGIVGLNGCANVQTSGVESTDAGGGPGGGPEQAVRRITSR